MSDDQGKVDHLETHNHLQTHALIYWSEATHTFKAKYMLKELR